MRNFNSIYLTNILNIKGSSGFHTIISHSDIKKTISTPKGYMLSYFDISSAEVRSIGYLSKDPKMIELFETHQDVYVYLGKNCSIKIYLIAGKSLEPN